MKYKSKVFLGIILILIAISLMVSYRSLKELEDKALALA
jgi:hypothetical protein